MDNDFQPLRNPDHDIQWKSIRWGVIAVCVAQLFLGRGGPAILNFIVSTWYIKREIAKGKEIDNHFLYGCSVPIVILIIQMVLWNMFSELLPK